MEIPFLGQDYRGLEIGPEFAKMLGGRPYLPNGAVTMIAHPIPSFGYEFFRELHRRAVHYDPRGWRMQVASLTPNEEMGCFDVASEVLHKGLPYDPRRPITMIFFQVGSHPLSAQEAVFTVRMLRQVAKTYNVPVVMEAPANIAPRKLQGRYEIIYQDIPQFAKAFDLELYVSKTIDGAWQVARGQHRLAEIEKRPAVPYEDLRAALPLIDPDNPTYAFSRQADTYPEITDLQLRIIKVSTALDKLWQRCNKV